MLLFFHALEESPVVGLEKRLEDPKKKDVRSFRHPKQFAFEGGVAFNTQVFCNRENTCPYKRYKRSLLKNLNCLLVVVVVLLLLLLLLLEVFLLGCMNSC